MYSLAVLWMMFGTGVLIGVCIGAFVYRLVRFITKKDEHEADQYFAKGS